MKLPLKFVKPSTADISVKFQYDQSTLVTRVELIDKDGRVYVRNPKRGRWFDLELQYQDGGKTLKIFLTEYQLNKCVKKAKK